jgi:hypothetical protein
MKLFPEIALGKKLPKTGESIRSLSPADKIIQDPETFIGVNPFQNVTSPMYCWENPANSADGTPLRSPKAAADVLLLNPTFLYCVRIPGAAHTIANSTKRWEIHSPPRSCKPGIQQHGSRSIATPQTAGASGEFGRSAGPASIGFARHQPNR